MLFIVYTVFISVYYSPSSFVHDQIVTNCEKKAVFHEVNGPVWWLEHAESMSVSVWVWVCLIFHLSRGDSKTPGTLFSSTRILFTWVLLLHIIISFSPSNYSPTLYLSQVRSCCKIIIVIIYIKPLWQIS